MVYGAVHQLEGEIDVKASRIKPNTKIASKHKPHHRSVPKKKMVSLIIKDHVIRYVDAKKPTTRAISAFGEYYLPPDVIVDGRIAEPNVLRTALRQCMVKWRLVNREVYFLVPDSMVIVRKLDIPPDVKEEAIKGYLYLELGNNIHLPFENPIFDFDVLERTEEKTEILLFAAPEDVINEYVALLKSVGLRPAAADISSLAIYRLYYLASMESDLPKGELTLSIQFDLQTVTVGILNGHKLHLIRLFKMNLPFESWEHKATAGGGTTLNWIGDESVIRYEINVMMGEIQRVINFYRTLNKQNEDQIAAILLTGDHPYLEEIASYVQESFGEAARTLNDELFETISKEIIPASHFLALGLSLKGGV